MEIISDTEEWFSEGDVSKKDEGKGKIKKDEVKQKGKLQSQKKTTNKPSQKKAPDSINKNVQVKKEEETETSKEKDGDSLLDLLELEMRARAIRALIRKEENIIPNTSKSTESNDTSADNARSKTEQDELKEKENCRRQLEMIISAQQSGTTEDEDVVLVVQPTPTIELLSSDSEGDSHGGVRINKKLQNERVMETEDNADNIGHNNGKSNNEHSESRVENLEENKVVENATETHKSDVFKRVHNNNVVVDDTQPKSNGKKKKVKKKSHSKEQSKSANSKVSTHKTKSSTENQHTKTIKTEDTKLNGNDHKNDSNLKAEHDNSLLKKRSSVKAIGTLDKVALDEEKSIDLDEIIDLDDYCDDMDDIENSENDKNKNKQIPEAEQSKSETETSGKKSNGTETWASRYYQTDDVQSVIKESKIQSEIRKRLRERQRLSKLTTSPKNSPSPPVSETTNKNVIENDPLGSVDEYLALKHTAAASLSTDNNDSSVTTDIPDTSSIIDHTSVVHSKEQNVQKETNLSVTANADTQLTTKNGETVNASTNSTSG